MVKRVVVGSKPFHTINENGDPVKHDEGAVVDVSPAAAKAFADQLKDPEVVKAEADAAAREAEAAAELAEKVAHAPPANSNSEQKSEENKGNDQQPASTGSAVKDALNKNQNQSQE